VDGEDVTLRIGGRGFAGWLDVGITRAMDAAAGTFRLAVTDRWSGQDSAWPIRSGDACDVAIGADLIIRGYAELVRMRLESGSRSIEVQGRDRSCDLVDCSALHTPDEWRQLDLLALANVLGKPFNIITRAQVPVGEAFATVKLDQGETALEALQRHARLRQLLVMPDGLGGLLLTRAGADRAQVALVEGANLLQVEATRDDSERFSQYVVKGQTGYSDDTDGDTEAHVSARATDAGIARYRPLLMSCEGDSTSATVKARAIWEANVRLGRALQVNATVQGWRQSPTGPLWTPNLRVTVRAPSMRLDEELLIREVTFTRGSTGTTTQLALVPPQAFAVEPPPPPKRDQADELDLS
jgi:prophage tail gpP-like protein